MVSGLLPIPTKEVFWFPLGRQLGCLADSVLLTFRHRPSHCILGADHHPHSTTRETEAQRGKVTELGLGLRRAWLPAPLLAATSQRGIPGITRDRDLQSDAGKALTCTMVSGSLSPASPEGRMVGLPPNPCPLCPPRPGHAAPARAAAGSLLLPVILLGYCCPTQSMATIP